MSRTNSFLSSDEQQDFENAMHLYPTNLVVTLHNKQMLKKLNMPIAQFYIKKRNHYPIGTHEEDEQLDVKILIFN